MFGCSQVELMIVDYTWSYKLEFLSL